MSTKITILYLDDEPYNLTGFKASLRMDYQVLIASNAAQAFEFLENHPEIRIVFSDQRMPGQTGVDFFEEVSLKYPLPVRVMLTAYTDVESIIGAINRGNIFRFVKKPWTQADLVGAIEEANKFYVANSMLAAKNVELKKAYEELSKFAYSVSHDIRGPLSGIAGALEIADDIDDVEEMKNIILMMKKSVKKMDDYVLSMHDYYSLQRGELSITEIDFNHVAEDLKDTYAILAKVNGVAFNVSVVQNEVFRSDYAPLRLILNNLLSNAFKYQDHDRADKSVDLIIEVTGSEAIIYVKDTGIGILETHLSEIFKLFYRSNALEVGAGFGLYNVKNALIKLSGDIEVKSVLHEGTIFKVTIPSI